MSLAAEKILRWKNHPDIFVRDVFHVTPDPKQDEVLRDFPKSQRQALKASKGTGKEQPNSLTIETPSGKRIWGSLKTGDKVFSVEGTPSLITNIYRNGVKPVYKVYFDDGSSTLAGKEHLWKVRGQAERTRKYSTPYRRETKDLEIWSILTTEEILQRGVRVRNGKWSGRQFEIPLHGPVQFDSNCVPLDSYLLGVWIGDGCRNTPTYSSKGDGTIESILRNRGFRLTSGGSDRIYVSGIKKSLKDLGLFSCYSYQKFIPECYKYSSIDSRIDLLKGLMDTDGTVDKNGSLEFDTTSKQLADDVIWLIRSLGGNAYLKNSIKKPFYYSQAGNKIAGRECYRISVRTIFCPFNYPKKITRWKKPETKSQVRYFKRYIDKIEFSHFEECSCIEIDHPSHCYLTNDFIVTHNSCCLAWLIWNFLVTRDNPRIAVTSISADTLTDTLWTELAKWQGKSKLLTEMFTWTKTRIVNKEKPETWWASARTWSKTADKNQQSNTLAGLHDEYMLFVLDESGGIPDAVMASAEAALASGTECHLVQAGNPTHLEGPLYRACTSEKNLWQVYEMTGDPDALDRSPRVSKEWALEQIAKYGRDNPWVLVNVFGKFPPASFNALIGPEELTLAVKRRYREPDFEKAPMVLGVDVARFGDDSSIIFPRQGLQAFNPFQYRGVNGTQGAELLSRKWNDLEADACFIDNTGGFGASWIDNLFRLGKSPIGIHFQQKPADEQYFNKRAEMAFNCVEWIKRGGAIPNIKELIDALTQTTYTFKGSQLLIEPKEDVKEKLGFSPDHMDALILTFAMPVEKQQREFSFLNKGNHQYEYDPFSRDRVRV